ncbi:MAG: MucB/RseB C-terminal domain-containing protein [Litorivicinaceae bacterium]
MMRLALILGAMLGWGGCAVALAAPDASARSLLQSMSQAVRSLSYTGTLVYQRADILASLVFSHDVKNGVEEARLRRLSGTAEERSRIGDQMLHSFPGPDVMRSGHPIPGAIAINSRRFFEAPYEFLMGERARVADRPTQIVDVRARDEHRHSYRFWIDEETSLLLKSQTLGPSQQVLEQYEFSDLKFQIPAVSVESDQPMQLRIHPVQAPDAVIQFSPASWLPQGYELVSALPSRAAGQSIYTLVYSDGLGSFSIFLELIGQVSQSQIQAVLGPTIAVGRDYALEGGSLRVTLVGEIPVATGMTIIDALDVEGLKALLKRSS